MDEPRIRPLNAERLNQVRKEWGEIAGNDLFEVEYQSTFTSIEQHLPKQGDTEGAFEVVDASGQANSILEIIDSRQGEQTKLINIYVTPLTLAQLSDEGEDARRRASQLYAEAYVSVIADALRRSCNDVKIYGRNNETILVLRALKNALEDAFADVEVKFEGRWLRIVFRDRN